MQVTRLEGPSSIEAADVEEPTGEIVIEVHAAGVTFPDVLLSQGRYQNKPPLPFTPGSEVAGVVRSTPAGGVFSVGDRVAAFCVLGGFAELVGVDAAQVFPIPDRVSFESAAAVPMNYLTMQFALHQRGALQSGETVLVQGAAGGVGSAAIQLARAMGAHVIAVTSTEQKAGAARAAGAHETVPADDFLASVKELTGGRGVDVVVDPVGGDRFTDSLRSLAPEGRLLVIGFTGGEIPTVRVNRLLLNNTSVVGVGWGAFWLKRPAYLQQQWVSLLPLLESGAIDPLLGTGYPLVRAAEAVAELADRRALGKVLVTTG